MRPGTVVVVEFAGAHLTKRRPALVVSTEDYNSERSDLIVALVTSHTAKATANTDHILEDWRSAGLNVPSAIRIFLQTYPRFKCREIGVLSDTDWAEVKVRLKRAISF